MTEKDPKVTHKDIFSEWQKNQKKNSSFNTMSRDQWFKIN